MNTDVRRYGPNSRQRLSKIYLRLSCGHLRLDLLFFYSRQFVSIRGCFVCLGLKVRSLNGADRVELI
jgi:hypothetical protein